MINVLRFTGGALFGAALIGAAVSLFHLANSPATIAATVSVAPTTAELAASDKGPNTDFDTAAAPPPAPDAAPATDPVVEVARQRARATLDHFFIERDLPGVTAASLLVTVEAPDLAAGWEDVWMGRCRETHPGRFTCIVDDSPQSRRLRLGDRHAFTRDAIADWKYTDANERIHGGYTIRATLPTMAADARAEIIPRLAPLPPG